MYLLGILNDCSNDWPTATIQELWLGSVSYEVVHPLEVVAFDRSSKVRNFKYLLLSAFFTLRTFITVLLDYPLPIHLSQDIFLYIFLLVFLCNIHVWFSVSYFLCLLGRHSTTWATPPDLYALVNFQVGSRIFAHGSSQIEILLHMPFM
jgi:hypothetical protein